MQRQVNPLEFAVGRRWVSRFTITLKGNVGESEQEVRITGREKITVPAGTFDAFVVAAHGFTTGTRPDGRAVEIRTRRWFAPEQVRLFVAVEEFRKTTTGNLTIANERRELVAFKQS